MGGGLVRCLGFQPKAAKKDSGFMGGTSIIFNGNWKPFRGKKSTTPKWFLSPAIFF